MKFARLAAPCLAAVVLLAAAGCATTPKESPYDKTAMFKRLDTDADGKVSRGEYYSMWRDEETARRYFDAYDANADGYLSAEEFQAPGITIMRW